MLIFIRNTRSRRCRDAYNLAGALRCNMDLKEIKRPSPAIIKLVECVGILLGIPPSTDKSLYKAPIPSNYDLTLQLLDTNFGGYISELATMTSSALSNKVANDLFAKTLEPGFGYEAAVNDGGLMCRDLFNAINLVMMSLAADEDRIPIIKTNVLTVVNGSMSSYAALDAATHIFKHGVVTAIALTAEDNPDRRLTGMMKSHLHQDLVRRCKLQYKLPHHCFAVESINVQSSNQIADSLVESVSRNSANILVYGMEDDGTFGENGDFGVPLWAATAKECNIPVLLTKKNSRIRPFNTISMSRTFMVFMDDNQSELMSYIFLQTLLYVRPGDSVVIVAVVPSSQPKGDERSSRFEGGSRAGAWVHGEDAPANEPCQPDWNADVIAKMGQQMQDMLISAQVEGTFKIEVQTEGKTTGRLISEIAKQEAIDIIVARKRTDLEIIVETVESAPSSVLLLETA